MFHIPVASMTLIYACAFKALFSLRYQCKNGSLKVLGIFPLIHVHLKWQAYGGWLRDNFTPGSLSEGIYHIVDQYARAYILVLFVNVLFIYNLEDELWPFPVSLLRGFKEECMLS